MKINNIKAYSTYNEGKSVVAERFIGMLKNNIFKHMTAISKNVYFDVLYIFNKYNNTVHGTIKMKPINVTGDSYAEYNEDFNKKDPKCKVGDHVRISKYKNIFAKGYTPNWSEEVFAVRKIKITVPWTYDVVGDLNGEENKTLKLYGHFLWMEFNYLKATATSRRQFTFYHSVPRTSWYSFYQPLKDERLSQPWSHPVALNMGSLDWESSTLTTRPLLHKLLEDFMKKNCEKQIRKHFE